MLVRMPLLASLNLPRRTMVVVLPPELGLANRFRIIASSIILAEDFDFSLRVHWPQSPECNSTILFPGIEPFHETSLLFQDPEVGVVKTSGIRLGKDESIFREKDLIALVARGQFARWNMSCVEYFERKRRIYERFTGDYSLSGLWIGLHVRRYESEYDWPVVPSSRLNNGSTSMIRWEETASTQIHFDAAREVLEKHPNAKVFVASNDISIKKRALEEFGERAAAYLPSEESQKRDDVASALIDWKLLADCALILHTFGSSFGEEAAVVRLTPSVRIRDDGHLVGMDINRGSSCNHPVFQQYPNYHLPMTLSVCDEFEEAWGFTSVYC